MSAHGSTVQFFQYNDIPLGQEDPMVGGLELGDL